MFACNHCFYFILVLINRRYHVKYCAERARAGSVAIFHVPQAKARLASQEIVAGFVRDLASKGLRCTTLSEVAAAVHANRAAVKAAAGCGGGGGAAAAVGGDSERSNDSIESSPKGRQGPARPGLSLRQSFTQVFERQREGRSEALGAAAKPDAQAAAVSNPLGEEAAEASDSSCAPL